MSDEQPTPLDHARYELRQVAEIGRARTYGPDKTLNSAQRAHVEVATAYALVSIAESLDKLVGIPPCPHCGSRAGATAWDAVEVDEHDPATWHRRCAACGGVLPEFER